MAKIHSILSKKYFFMDSLLKICYNECEGYLLSNFICDVRGAELC